VTVIPPLPLTIEVPTTTSPARVAFAFADSRSGDGRRHSIAIGIQPRQVSLPGAVRYGPARDGQPGLRRALLVSDVLRDFPWAKDEPDQDIDFCIEAGDSVESISALRMIEETARHAGHAAILRELTDGAIGQ
jgi:hypothetical protein